MGMDGDGSEWIGMDENGWEWMGMDRNGSEWMGMAENARIAFSPLVAYIFEQERN
jgi:hypothetical protein